MSEKTEDRDRLYEQGVRMAVTSFAGQVIAKLAEVFYGTTRDVDLSITGPFYQLVVRHEPTLRVQVRVSDPRVLAATCKALRALGWNTREKTDHLVVIP